MTGPERWEMASEDGAVMFTSEGGGCLQMQGHRKKEGDVNDDDLDEVASDHLEAGAPVRDVRLGDFVGFEVDYDAGELSCREWFLRSGPVLLFGTLVRPVERRGAEDEAVELALVSLRVDLGQPRGKQRGKGSGPRRRRRRR